MTFRTIFYLLFVFVVFIPQTRSQTIDSLTSQSFDELYRISKNLFVQKDIQKALLYFEAYKRKAVREQNVERLVSGYRSISNWQKPLEAKLIYADSAIHIAKTTGNDELIGNALYTKGVAYYTDNDWQKTLEFYLLADNHISKSNNEYSKYKLKYAIFQAHYTLGNYEEAHTIIQNCVTYFEQYQDNNHKKGYLNSLHALGLCLNRMGKYIESSEVNRLGAKKVAEWGISKMDYSFKASEGINQYHQGNYVQSLELLESTLPYFITSENTNQEAVLQFFIGKNYMELNKEQEAIAHFEKVDSIFSETGYLRDDMVENYVFLINNAQKQNNLKKELYYTNRLLEADRLLHTQYKDIAVTVHKKYDTQKLQESKAAILKLLGQKSKSNQWLSWSLFTAFLCIVLVTVRYVYYKRKFKKLYHQFIEKSQSGIQSAAVVSCSQPEIKQEVSDRILKKLEQFESNKGFVKQNLTLSKLAESLKTNPKYLSKVIMDGKQKEYTQYINDLRINHVIDLLSSKKHLNYTIEALAGEVGFNSAKGFNSVFYKVTGMKFSDFLKEFRKESKENSYFLDKRKIQDYELSQIS